MLGRVGSVSTYTISSFITLILFSSVGHPWLAGHQDVKIPLDMIIYRLVKAYICSSSLRKAALGVCISWIHDASLNDVSLLSPLK